MAGVKGVMGAFHPFGEAADTAGLAQRVKKCLSAREQFMGIGLVTHVPDYFISGGIKDVMESDGKFDDAQVWSQMPPGAGYRADNLLPDFLGQLGQLVLGQLL